MLFLSRLEKQSFQLRDQTYISKVHTNFQSIFNYIVTDIVVIGVLLLYKVFEWGGNTCNFTCHVFSHTCKEKIELMCYFCLIK